MGLALGVGMEGAHGDRRPALSDGGEGEHRADEPLGVHDVVAVQQTAERPEAGRDGDPRDGAVGRHRKGAADADGAVADVALGGAIDLGQLGRRSRSGP